jgi:hypothetical protein
MISSIPWTAPAPVQPAGLLYTPGDVLAEIIAKKTAKFDAAGLCQWTYQSCRWCREGYGPAVESSVTPGWFVHPDTPVGRVACGVQDRIRFPKCADCGRSDDHHEEGCSGRYGQ